MSESTIVLHHLENSRSQRVLWLLEELGLEYTIKIYKRLPNKLAPPELLQVHPLGKSPVLVDDNQTIAESGAIVQYLIEKYGKDHFAPPPAGYITNLYYTHFGEGSLMPYLTNFLIFTIIGQRSPWLVRWLVKRIMDTVKNLLIVPNVNKAADMIESDLSKSPTGWFAGGNHPTSGDFMMLFPMETIGRVQGDRIGPRITAWVDQVHARPAYQRALEKGGPYAYAKKREAPK